MRNIAIIDESFDSSVTSTYHLSIQYCDLYCSFAILDTSRMKYIAFKNFQFPEPVPPVGQADQIRSLLHGESYLNRRFKSVYFMYQTPNSVLVPTPLFKKEDPEVYLQWSSEINSLDKVIFRKIPAIDSYTVFSIPSDFLDQVGFTLGHVQFFHQSCSQIDQAFTESGNLTVQSRVFACINPGFVDLLVIRSEQVLLYNSFTIKDTNDLVFFILYMFEQFHLSQDESPLIISGFIERYPGARELLDRYLRKVVMRGLPESFTYSNGFGDLVKHHYTHFINLARCE